MENIAQKCPYLRFPNFIVKGQNQRKCNLGMAKLITDSAHQDISNTSCTNQDIENCSRDIPIVTDCVFYTDTIDWQKDKTSMICQYFI